MVNAVPLQMKKKYGQWWTMFDSFLCYKENNISPYKEGTNEEVYQNKLIVSLLKYEPSEGKLVDKEPRYLTITEDELSRLEGGSMSFKVNGEWSGIYKLQTAFEQNRQKKFEGNAGFYVNVVKGWVSFISEAEIEVLTKLS